MHEDLTRAAMEAGLDTNKIHALAIELSKPSYARRWTVTAYPKPSGTKTRRKAERQRKKAGRNQKRKS